MKITEDFIGNETKELTKTKIASILRWWGFNPDSYSTWGNARVDMNNILSGSSSSTISDRERASSFLSKINYINDTDTVISDTLFAANEPGVWYDPSDIKLDWRRNLLTKTEQFDDAVWPKDAVSVTPDVVAAPDGSLTADKLVASATNANHLLNRTGAFKTVSGVLYTYTMFAKAAEYSWIRLQIQATAFPETWANFNVATGAVGLTTGNVQTIITAEANGWYRCSITARANASDNSGVQPFVLDSNRGTASPSYTGDGTSGIYIWGAQLEVGSTATPYQRITDGIQDYYAVQALPVLYQDSAGTTPVTAVEQPVGLMLDKSKGLVLGPELVTNGTFDTNLDGWLQPNGIAWSWVSDGAACNTTTNRFLERPLSLPANTTVLFSFEIKQRTSGRVRLRLRNSGVTVAGFGFVQDAKVYSGVLNTGSGVTAIDIEPEFGVGFVGTIDNISVRELPGNHAYQTTATSRPVLSARYNLLTKTEQFDDAAWTKTRTSVVANTIAAPDGTLTADKFTEDFNTGTHQLQQSLNWSASTAYTFSFFAKAGERSIVRVFDGTWAGGESAQFNLSTGVATVLPSYPSPTVSMISVGNGWYRCICTLTTVGAFSNSAGFVRLRLSDGSTTNYTGDGTSGIYIWGADLRVANDGANLPPYQRVNTETDYDTVGFPHYLRFDGVDDWLVTNTITPGIDKVQVFAGVRKLSDASIGCVAELSANFNNAAGSFMLAAPFQVGAPNLTFLSRGSASPGVAGIGAYSSPVSAVMGGYASVSEDISRLRVNGAQAAQSATDQGTGNFLAYPLYIGRRGGTSLPFNGHLYSLIVRFGSNLPAATIEKTEKYINGLTKAY